MLCLIIQCSILVLIQTMSKPLKKNSLKRKHVAIHYYIDESGSPEFYGKRKKLLIDKPGYSPFLIIGLVSILNRKRFVSEINNFKKQLLEDEDLKHIYTLHQPDWYLHAKGDHNEVRERFFNFLANMPFRGYFIIGRKNLHLFEKLHHGKEQEFYFDLVRHLLSGRFKEYSEYKIYLSSRSGNNLKSFSDSIKQSIEHYNRITKRDDIEPQYTYSIIPNKSMPELSVVDYQLWALQRYIFSDDKSYFKKLENKYCFIYDIYGPERERKKRFYNAGNPFEIEKMGHL
jgi:hypothetical protein